MSARIPLAVSLFLAAFALVGAAGSLLAEAPLLPGIEDLPPRGAVVVKRLAVHSALLNLDDGSVALVPRHRLPEGAAAGNHLEASRLVPARGHLAVASLGGDGRGSPDRLP